MVNQTIQLKSTSKVLDNLMRVVGWNPIGGISIIFTLVKFEACYEGDKGENKMSKCPKDANVDETSDYGVWCRERFVDKERIGVSYICTRDMGHGGKHHAHYGTTCCKVW